MSATADKPPAESANDAQRFLTSLFVIATVAPILALLLARVYWIAEIFSSFGFSWSNEEFYPINIFKLHLVSGDPAFYVYLPAFIIGIIVLLLRGKQTTFISPYLWSFKAMFIYSAIMIIVQIIIKIAIYYYNYDNPDQYFFWTKLTWGDSPDLDPTNSITLLSVDDPHILALLASLIGIIVVAHPEVVKKVMGYIIKNGSP